MSSRNAQPESGKALIVARKFVFFAIVSVIVFWCFSGSTSHLSWNCGNALHNCVLPAKQEFGVCLKGAGISGPCGETWQARIDANEHLFSSNPHLLIQINNELIECIRQNQRDGYYDTCHDNLNERLKECGKEYDACLQAEHDSGVGA